MNCECVQGCQPLQLLFIKAVVDLFGTSVPHRTVHPNYTEQIELSFAIVILSLAVPSVKLSIGFRSFSVSGPTVCNAFPDYLRNPTLPINVFISYFKNFICSLLIRLYSALETLCLCAI